MTLERKPITNFRSHFCVRVDDGSAGQDQYIREWLDAGFDVTLALNFGFHHIESAGKMSKRDIKGLQTYAEKRGRRLWFMHHSNWNLGLKSLDTYTYAELLDEFTLNYMRDLFGLENFIYGYIQPGDTAQLSWVNKRPEFVAGMLRDAGIEFAYGLHYYTTVTGLHTNNGHGLPSADVIGNGAFISPSTGRSQRPGAFTNPFRLPEGYTVDLRSTITQCGMYDGTNWVNDPRSGARPFVLGTNFDGGVGNIGSSINDANKTFQWTIMRSLGFGGDFMLGVHGDWRAWQEATTNLSTGRGSAGTPTILPYNFQTKHAAWYMRHLVDLGAAVAVSSPRDLAERAIGIIEPGTDIVDNPGLKVLTRDVVRVIDINPSQVANRRVDIDLPVITGWGAPHAFQSVYNNGCSSIESAGVYGGTYPQIDPDAAGVSWEACYDQEYFFTGGKGMLLKPRTPAGADQSLTAHSALLAVSQIPPGIYEMRFDAFLDGGDLILDNHGLVGYANYNEVRRTMENAGDDAAVFKQRVEIGTEYVQSALVDDKIVSYRVRLVCPHTAVPHLVGTASFVNNFCGGTLNAGATYDLHTITVANAVPGAPVKIIRRAHGSGGGMRPQDQLVFGGVVTARNTVTVYVRNPTASNYTFSAQTVGLNAYVEDVEFQSRVDAMEFTLTEPWMWSYQVKLSHSGAGARTNLHNVRFIKVADI